MKFILLIYIIMNLFFDAIKNTLKIKKREKRIDIKSIKNISNKEIKTI